jgi:hypothetical protein
VPELRKLQQDFSRYITNKAGLVMDDVVENGRIDGKTRLDIYRNAYHVRLKKCIEFDHSILGTYLGDELFDQMAASYIRDHPSRNPSLRHFCNQLPEFLKQNDPFKSLPIIAEIAAFERKLLDAFDGADHSRKTVSDLLGLPAKLWPKMRLVFHPSLQVFEACWNSVECWQALKNDKTPPEARKQEAWWFIWRNSERLTEFRSMSRDGYILYRCLKDNYCFADACELLKEYLPEEQIGIATVENLRTWLNLGVIGVIKTGR